MSLYNVKSVCERDRICGARKNLPSTTKTIETPYRGAIHR